MQGDAGGVVGLEDGSRCEGGLGGKDREYVSAVGVDVLLTVLDGDLQIYRGGAGGREE